MLRTPRVGIIGPGMSGIGVGAKLWMAGIESFRIYEKPDRIGGTCQANTYPGLSCDVPSRYYSYTFAPNPNWTHVYSPGPEIWAYLDRVARDYELYDRVSVGTEVAAARWVDGRWVPRTSAGEEARVRLPDHGGRRAGPYQQATYPRPGRWRRWPVASSSTSAPPSGSGRWETGATRARAAGCTAEFTPDYEPMCTSST